MEDERKVDSKAVVLKQGPQWVLQKTSKGDTVGLTIIYKNTKT